MKISRRGILKAAGALAALAPSALQAAAGAGVQIHMQGALEGALVWFDPVGIRVEPGQEIQWVNLDAGNSHTSTAYHPANGNHALRMPGDATPWNSGYLLPNETFSTILNEPGVYDYFCMPHEHAGMVGRIVVGTPPADSWIYENENTNSSMGVPSAALKTFPSLAKILEMGIVHKA